MIAMRSSASSRNELNTSLRRRLVARSMALALGRSIVTSRMTPSLTILIPSDMAFPYRSVELFQADQRIDGDRPQTRRPDDDRVDVDFNERIAVRRRVVRDPENHIDQRIDVTGRLTAVSGKQFAHLEPAQS